MTHATRARKERGAKIVVIDAYENATAQQADHFLCVRPGTDAALACGVMHVLFRDGLADRDYMARFTDVPDELEAHLSTRTPSWAEAYLRCAGQEDRGVCPLGRQDQEDLSCVWDTAFAGAATARSPCMRQPAIASVAGSWQYEGGGAFHNNGAIYRWDRTMIEGLDAVDPVDPRARPVTHWPHPHRRPRRPDGRTAGVRHADPEHQPDDGGTGSWQRYTRASPAKISSCACTSSS